ncbi:hypothetical protein BESB_081450 [Besnoitia besnoiti]|uniref:Uncharacterized protein n=1 Tax=Besnoitia besnoiti TaxID=94643 RepID=A0A2A9MAI3_BESBE|nr:hypothetical protein BESB_081450 [Besnoitia besnoiti]PFH32946.1 hypothetical protein BESB_081450 [Besnoitia besnoiti]
MPPSSLSLPASSAGPPSSRGPSRSSCTRLKASTSSPEKTSLAPVPASSPSDDRQDRRGAAERGATLLSKPAPSSEVGAPKLQESHPQDAEISQTGTVGSRAWTEEGRTPEETPPGDGLNSRDASAAVKAATRLASSSATCPPTAPPSAASAASVFSARRRPSLGSSAPFLPPRAAAPSSSAASAKFEDKLSRSARPKKDARLLLAAMSSMLLSETKESATREAEKRRKEEKKGTNLPLQPPRAEAASAASSAKSEASLGTDHAARGGQGNRGKAEEGENAPASEEKKQKIKREIQQLCMQLMLRSSQVSAASQKEDGDRQASEGEEKKTMKEAAAAASAALPPPRLRSAVSLAALPSAEKRNFPRPHTPVASAPRLSHSCVLPSRAAKPSRASSLAGEGLRRGTASLTRGSTRRCSSSATPAASAASAGSAATSRVSAGAARVPSKLLLPHVKARAALGEGEKGEVCREFPSLPTACAASPAAELLLRREAQMALVHQQLTQSDAGSRPAFASFSPDQDFSGWVSLPRLSSPPTPSSASASSPSLSLTSSSASSSASSFFRGEEVYVSRHTLTRSSVAQPSTLTDARGDRVCIQAQLLEQVLAGAQPRQVFEYFFGHGVPIDASVSRFLEKRRLQNTLRRVKEHLEKKLPEFFASKGLPCLATAAPFTLFRAAFWYLAQVAQSVSSRGSSRALGLQRSGGGLRALPTPVAPPPTPVAPPPTSASALGALFALAPPGSPSRYLTQTALAEALDSLQWWPAEINAVDRKEVLLCLALADEDLHPKAAMARDRLLPQGVSERGWIFGFLTVPYNLPDWPVTQDLLPPDPRPTAALPFLLSPASAPSSSSSLRCAPYFLLHAPQAACVPAAARACFCGFLHLCRLALLICSAFGEKVNRRFPQLLLRLSTLGDEASPPRAAATPPGRAGAPADGAKRKARDALAPAPLGVSPYALSEVALASPQRDPGAARGRASARDDRDKKSKTRTASNATPSRLDSERLEDSKAAKKKRCKLPAWHLCQDVLLSRLVSLEEIQVSLDLVIPAPWVFAALQFIIGTTSRGLTPVEWLALLHPCSPLALPLDADEIVSRFDAKFQLQGLSRAASASFAAPSFMENNFLSFFTLSHAAPPPSTADDSRCRVCGLKLGAQLEEEEFETRREARGASPPPGEGGAQPRTQPPFAAASSDARSRLGLHWDSFVEEKERKKGAGGASAKPAPFAAPPGPPSREAPEEAAGDRLEGSIAASLPFFAFLSEDEKSILLQKERVYGETYRFLGTHLAEFFDSEATKKAFNRLATAAVSASVIEPGMPQGGTRALLPLVKAGGSCCFDVYALRACCRLFFNIFAKSSLFALLHDLV